MKAFLSKFLSIKTIKDMLCTLLIMACLAQITGCAPNVQPTSSLQTDLTVEVLYPIKTTEVEMGQSLKSIVKVSDKEGRVVENAQVALSFKDSDGRLISSIPAVFGNGDVYRSEAWNVPHKMREGAWTLSVNAKTDMHQGTVTSAFHVKNSTSETLLYKYGFWVNSPSLKGIVPTLTKEQGDAQNGAILWGGIIPTQHLFPESWLEVQWRKGDFNLTSADKVREFILNTLGNSGVYRTRALESFEQEKFKDWDAWKVKVRGQLSIYDEQWMIFYAPEVDKTYALGTTVALPPSGMDAHDVLREGFEVHPEIQANGIALQSLLVLLPAVELTGPEIGTRFFGTDEPIILKWKPVKELAQDEYYLVSVDFNYAETNSRMDYVTRETQFVLPEELYRIPNCSVFNWQVTLMKQTNTTPDGQPEGIPISFNSLYWYVQWFYPVGETAPFNPLCPNQQF
jgi:hypothetical protein